LRGIKYISLGDATGYAIAAKGHIRALVEAGIPVTWEPMIPGRGLGLGHEPGSPLDVSDPILVSAYKRRIEYDRVIVHTIPEYYPHFVQRERSQMSGDGRIFGSTVWETDRLPRHWPSLLANLDGLIVPTEWNREVFRASGVNTSIAVVPHASEFEGKSPEDGDPLKLMRRWPELAECFVFYSINSWLERKGLPLLIASFCDAFRSSCPRCGCAAYRNAYPPDQHWDICRSAPSEETMDRMCHLPFPKSDPDTWLRMRDIQKGLKIHRESSVAA
jgi:hypothetical protein